jgi:hypothetical protein
MVTVSLDISKTSTAMVLAVGNKTYFYNYTIKKETNKWNKMLDFVHFRHFEFNDPADYSEREFYNLKIFVDIANSIIDDIAEYIENDEPICVYTEGYSYSSFAGHIIDLVTVSSIIRSKIYESFPNLSKFVVVSPKHLKTMACELVYGTQIVQTGKRIIKNVKITNPNPDGIKGGEFKKPEMLRAFADSNISNSLKDFIVLQRDELLKVKSIPKPIDDLVDANFLSELAKTDLI